MKLPNFFQKKDNFQKATYFGLFLKEEEGVILLMETISKSIRIVDKEKFKFTSGFENLSEDVDQALSQIETRTKRTSNKLMIFVYSHFIDEKNHQIKEPYLQKIKTLVKELELKALGFIDALEAATNYLEDREGSPLTAIIIEFDKTTLTMAVFKGGQRVLQKVVPKTDNVIDDITYIFDSQKGKILMPARIIVYDSDSIDDISSKILTHQWTEDLFIQLPKVEIIREDNLIQGLVNVFSEQIVDLDGETEEEKMPKEVLGFAIGRDVIETAKEKEKEKEKQEIEETIENKNIPESKDKRKIRLPVISFNFLGNLLDRMKIIKFPIIVPLLGIAVGILLILSSVEFFFHKAELKVYFPSQAIKKDLDLSETINSSIIKSSEASYDANDTAQTTGRQTVGEKAKGEITIYNFDDSEKSFSKDTVVTVDNLKFTMDSDAKVASASVSGPVKTAGQGKVKVTANDIGTESNVARGKKFQIADFSQSNYYGMNDNGAFVGGSKKNIQTVAKKDLEDLKNKIIAKAKTGEDELIKKNMGQNDKVINELTDVTITNEEYTKEVGEEATSVGLKAKAQIEYFFYDNNKLQDKILELLKEEVKAGYEINRESLKYQILKPVKQENEIKLGLNVDARAIKNVDKKDLIKKLVFKDKKAIEKILKEEYNAEGYDLNIKNPIPFLKTYMPITQNNINIDISSL